MKLLDKPKRWVTKNVTGTNWFYRTVMLIIGAIIGFAPTYFSIWLYIELNPAEFWQKIVMITVLLVTLGSVQLVFLGFLFFYIIAVLTD